MCLLLIRALYPSIALFFRTLFRCVVSAVMYYWFALWHPAYSDITGIGLNFPPPPPIFLVANQLSRTLALLTVEGTLDLDAKGSLPKRMRGRTVRASIFYNVIFVCKYSNYTTSTVKC